MKILLLFLAISIANIASPPAHAQSSGDRQEVKLCNRHSETVYVAVGLGLVIDRTAEIRNMPQFAVQYSGWYELAPGECQTKRIPKYADRNRKTLRSFYIYGETKGLFGGAIKKVWEGKDHRGCMNRKRGSEWVSASLKVVNGAAISNRCNDDGEFSAGMEALNHKNADGQLYYNFGG
ncbi:DUF1036 domain-containing protein [Parasphingorhabdus cellanae]|uniref:DUF1036 domain-containing protein n=1 Tax=Parasphingorhabdus cellanae TaxID=2806553 RepID=A0ABX7T0I0_9SPHN|nr:DUF1036 domain-containing protein [Parasphingorhabdus cellanae]QTD54468.1 DUF1036 domain-containing protein [Parasphingorhabdus cellanae]